MPDWFLCVPAVRRARGVIARAVVLTVAVVVGSSAFAATTLRVATYNIDADTTDFATSGLPPEPYLNTVLGAMNAVKLAGNAQPLDVLVLQELNGTASKTLDAIVNDLNSQPGVAPGTYAYDTNVYTQSGYSPNTTGNGPSGLIYNTKTVKEVGSPHYVGTVSTSGQAREPVRYELQPVNYGPESAFYVYVDHYKALGDSTSVDRRTVEAQAVRADADALPANSHILYAGDFNLTGGSNEQAYQTLLASGGNGQAFDPLNTSFTTSSASQVKLYTESATSLTARFDFQLVSGAVLAQNNQAGLQLLANTYTALGNSYYAADGTLTSTAVKGGSIAASGNTGVDSADGLSPSIRSALTNLTDHLPVLADYTIAGLAPVPEPASVAVFVVAGGFLLTRRRGKSGKF